MADEPDIEDLERSLSRRVVSITVDDETGQLELDDDGFTSWELVGIAGWLEMVAHDQLMDDDADET